MARALDANETVGTRGRPRTCAGVGGVVAVGSAGGPGATGDALPPETPTRFGLQGLFPAETPAYSFETAAS
jgi:hypothetical protein